MTLVFFAVVVSPASFPTCSGDPPWLVRAFFLCLTEEQGHRAKARSSKLLVISHLIPETRYFVILPSAGAAFSIRSIAGLRYLSVYRERFSNEMNKQTLSPSWEKKTFMTDTWNKIYVHTLLHFVAI